MLSITPLLNQAKMAKNRHLTHKILRNFTFQLLSFFWITVFSCVYIAVIFLTNTLNNQNAGQNKLWNDLFNAIDNYHILIIALIFIPLIVSIVRVLFPKKFEKLGDYFFLAILGLYNLHTLSQIFLGSCILTLIPHWISNYIGIPSVYTIYVWNPLKVPEILLLPYYFVQLIFGFWISTRLVNILKNDEGVN